MATELNANGISFGGPIYNQQGSDTAANTYQRSAPAVVKIGFGSASTVNQGVGGGDGNNGYIDGTEVNMGVPGAADNLYRIWYQTVTDDWDGSISGVGIRMFRHTPSAGWQELLSQGSHASYDNNMNDWYRTNNGIFGFQFIHRIQLKHIHLDCIGINTTVVTKESIVALVETNVVMDGKIIVLKSGKLTET